MNNLDQLRAIQKQNKEVKKCSAKGCNNELQKGDILFCFNCRSDWVEFCVLNNIHEKSIPHHDIKEFVLYYQQNKYKNAA